MTEQEMQLWDEKTMCILPFMHIYTWPSGQVFPCCFSGVPSSEPIGDMNENTLEEIFNGEKLKSIRKQMSVGKQPAVCFRCFQQEEQGIESFREQSNTNFGNHEHLIDKAIKNNYEVEDFKLYYWDFRFSNLCNFSCRSCSLSLSSKWYEDHKKLYGGADGHSVNKKGVIQLNESQLAQVKSIIDKDINDVDLVYFAGGEPLINDMHYYILEKLIKAKRFDCHIHYNTNLSTLHYKKYDLVEMWSNFMSVGPKVDGGFNERMEQRNKKLQITVGVSIDAIGPRAEYIRYGTKWSKIEENLKKLLQIPYIQVVITPTISLLNVMHLPDYLDYFIEYHKMSSYDIWLTNVLSDPIYYNIASLPHHMKIKAHDTFTAYLEKKINIWPQQTLNDIADKFNGILHSMDTNIEVGTTGLTHRDEEFLKTNKERFIGATRRLDDIRGEDFTKTFPELACLFQTEDNKYV
jgi:MoaA/NifB/PqqE/SkfB family radical SAM enzyme